MPKDENIIGKTTWLKMDKDGNITDNSKMLKNITDKDVSNLLEKCQKDKSYIKTLTSNCSTVGEGAFFECPNLVEIKLDKCIEVKDGTFEQCASLRKVSLTNCKNVGVAAFFECSNLTEVKLDKCTEIKEDAFSGCKNLKKISLPNCKKIGVWVFNECTSLAKIKLDKCMEIGDNAFNGCDNLEEIYLPNCKKADNLPKISNKIKKLVVPGEVLDKLKFPAESKDNINIRKVDIDKKTWWLKIDKGGYITDNSKFLLNITKKDVQKAIPDGGKPETSIKGLISNCKTIGKEAFCGCKNLKEVKLPNCTEVEEKAFYNCENLEKLSAPKLKKVGSMAFHGCNKIKNPKDIVNFVKIELIKKGQPKFTKKITEEIEKDGKCNFDCTNLEELDDNTVKNIGSSKFEKCNTLKTVNLPSVERVWWNAFRECQNLEAVTLSTAKRIENGAFREYQNLTSVKLPAVAHMEGMVFHGCKKLKNVELPQCVFLHSSGFEECEGLEAVNLPKIQTIGQEAFKGCSQLKVFKAPVCYSMGTGVLCGCRNLTELDIRHLPPIEIQYLFGEYEFKSNNNVKITLSKDIEDKSLDELDGYLATLRGKKHLEEKDTKKWLKMQADYNRGRTGLEKYLRGYYPNATIVYA